MTLTAYDIMQNLVGEIRELPGAQHHPFIQWGHMLCGLGPDTADEVPWCSTSLNAIMKLAGAPRSRSARARSWLNIGRPTDTRSATPDWCVVILRRGSGDGAAGPEVLNAPGHVGLFASYDVDRRQVYVLGGNQGDAISIAPFKEDLVLGIRRVR